MAQPFLVAIKAVPDGLFQLVLLAQQSVPSLVEPTPGGLHQQALLQVIRTQRSLLQGGIHGFSQAHVKLIHTLGLIHQFPPGVPEPGCQMHQLCFPGGAGCAARPCQGGLLAHPLA